MYQQVSAVRRGRDVVHEQFIQAIIFIPVREREVQRPLNLPAELLRLASRLAAMRQAAAAASATCRCET